MKLLKSDFIKKIAAAGVVAVLGISVGLSACTKPSSQANRERLDALEAVAETYSSAANHTVSGTNLAYAEKSGLISLYFDKTSFAPVIRDSTAGKYWAALPYENAGEQPKAAVLELTVSRGNKVYTLNSQDNAVAFGTARYTPSESGISITYDMAPSKETADKKFDALSDGELYVSVTVQYTLADGALKATVNCGKILCANGFTVETLRLLPYFGEHASSAAGDYIFVPDGSGALIMTADKASSDYPVREYDVYGRDLGVYGNEERTSGTALLPAYGMKTGTSAFLALIQSGDAIATVQSHTGAQNRVGASFMVTDTKLVNTGKGYERYTGAPYSGDISISFRFLSGRSAEYSGMAAACREQLIRAKVLSTKTIQVKDGEYLPFCLELEGAVTKNSPRGYTVLSDYGQAMELLSMMKAKSINNIALRYNGVFTGANTQDLLSKAKRNGKLGGKREWEDLQNYMSTQQFELYANVDMLSYNRKSASAKKAAVGITGDTLMRTPANLLYGTGEAVFLSDPAALRKNVTKFIENNDKLGVAGYCIDDAGKLAYSDYTGGFTLRSGVAAAEATAAAQLATDHKLMVDTGNIYLVKNADIVMNVPTQTAYPQTNGYVQIPFYEMVLHGIADYTTEPANLSENPERALMKALEYGALPNFNWYCTETGTETDKKYYYENTLVRAATYYETANTLLSDLRGARMTAHTKLQSGVYCTEYNNNTLIYFNYNDTPATAGGITIAPMSYIRVN